MTLVPKIGTFFVDPKRGATLAQTRQLVDMEKIVSLCKRRGFIFPSSEIYGGLGSTWDYGPLGVELKRNVKEAWWQAMVHRRDDMTGLDAAILMHPRTWKASGHVDGFSDPLVECRSCNIRFREDHLANQLWDSIWWRSLTTALGLPTPYPPNTLSEIEAWDNFIMEYNSTLSKKILKWVDGDGNKYAPNLPLVKDPETIIPWFIGKIQGKALFIESTDVLQDFRELTTTLSVDEHSEGHRPCPNCGGLISNNRRMFNLMLKSLLGPVDFEWELLELISLMAEGHEGNQGDRLNDLKQRLESARVYLRPETAQGIFVNFENVLNSSRRKLPFGIAQIGKAFRNEITPGNFTFRTREFEQMEIEFFVKPGTDEGWQQRWLTDRMQWYLDLGIRKENLRLRQHGKEELAHYAKDCYDIEYRFSWGWAELEGIANRTDFDLRRHAEFSGRDLSYYDEETKERYIPYVIEPSGGVDRATLAFLVDAYDEEPDPGGGDARTVLHLNPALAPVKVAILPLSRNQKLVPKAREVYELIRQHFPCQYDDAQSIGRRYRRQDETGTPLCVTIDFQTVEEDNAVTIRDRDTMKQIRTSIPKLLQVLKDKLKY